MKKILVPTDMTNRSKAAIKFAIQLAKGLHAEVTFLHVNKHGYETEWTEPEQRATIKMRKEHLQEQLENLVLEEYELQNIIPISYQTTIFYHFGIVNSIVEYAKAHGCDYICATTHASDGWERLLGSDIDNLVREASVPVFCVPYNYEPQPITRVLYASDMEDYENELATITNLAQAKNAKIESVHFTEDEQQVPLTNRELQHLNLNIVKKDSTLALAEQIANTVADRRPSLVVMFTKRDRSLYEMLFKVSLTRKLMFGLHAPLLICYKT